MAVRNEFIAYLLEMLKPFGPVKAKAMFGGFGIYRHGLMFGLVSEDTLYFKADDKNRPDFEARGLEPFIYKRKGKEFALSYYQAPHDAIDNAEELCLWAERAYDAALSAAQGKHEKKGRKK